MSTGGSLSAAYFDGLYAKKNDPWRFATSPYEQAKYAATLQALATARFAKRLRSRLFHRRVDAQYWRHAALRCLQSMWQKLL